MIIAKLTKEKNLIIANYTEDLTLTKIKLNGPEQKLYATEIFENQSITKIVDNKVYLEGELINTLAQFNTNVQINGEDVLYNNYPNDVYLNDVTIIDAKIDNLIGLISWFPFQLTPSEGWLLCDGSIIDKSIHPEYTKLVDLLRNSGSNFIVSGNTNQAKLPNINNKYIKSIRNGYNVGDFQNPQIKNHTHTGMVNNVDSTHSHYTTFASHNHITSYAGSHTHSISNGSHFHYFCINYGTAGGGILDSHYALKSGANLSNTTGSYTHSHIITSKNLTHNHTVYNANMTHTHNVETVSESHTHTMTDLSTISPTNYQDVNNIGLYAYIKY